MYLFTAIIRYMSQRETAIWTYHILVTGHVGEHTSVQEAVVCQLDLRAAMPLRRRIHTGWPPTVNMVGVAGMFIVANIYMKYILD